MFSLEPLETWVKEIKIGNTSFICDGFRTYLMGELMLTPTEPGHPLFVKDETQAVHVAEEMLAHGVGLLEVTSSLQATSRAVELVISALRVLKDTFSGVPLAINTRDHALIEAALKEDLVDFITVQGWSSREEMMQLLKDYPDVVVALGNDLLYLQEVKDTNEDFVEVSFNFFKLQLERSGILDRKRVFLDLGIGLGLDKRREFALLGTLAEFRNEIELPIVVTVRWNSYFEDMTQLSIEDRFSPLVAFATLAMLQGADVIRTRDVLAMSEMLSVVEDFKREFGD